MLNRRNIKRWSLVFFLACLSIFSVGVVLLQQNDLHDSEIITNPLLRDGLDHIRTLVFFPHDLKIVRKENDGRVYHWRKPSQPIPFPPSFPKHTSVYLNYGPPAATLDWLAIRERCKLYNDIQLLEDYECRAERFRNLAYGKIVELVRLNGFSEAAKKPQLVLRLEDNSLAFFKPCRGIAEQPEAEVFASHMDDLFGFHRAATVVMRNISVTYLESLVEGVGVEQTFVRSVLSNLRDVCAFNDGEYLIGALISGWHDVQPTVTLAKRKKLGINADEIQEFAQGEIEPVHPLEAVMQNHIMFFMMELIRRLTKNEFCTGDPYVVEAQQSTKTVTPWHRGVEKDEVNIVEDRLSYQKMDNENKPKRAFGSRLHLYTEEGVHRRVLPKGPPPTPPCTLITMDMDRGQFDRKKYKWDEQVTFCKLCVMDDETYQSLEYWYERKTINNGTLSLSHMMEVSLSHDPFGLNFAEGSRHIMEYRLSETVECLQRECRFFKDLERLV